MLKWQNADLNSISTESNSYFQNESESNVVQNTRKISPHVKGIIYSVFTYLTRFMRLLKPFWFQCFLFYGQQILQLTICSDGAVVERNWKLSETSRETFQAINILMDYETFITFWLQCDI